MKKSVSASYKLSGRGFDRDEQAAAIFEKYDGEFVGSGTSLPDQVRDLQYAVPERRVKALSWDLKRAGFKVTSEE